VDVGTMAVMPGGVAKESSAVSAVDRIEEMYRAYARRMVIGVYELTGNLGEAQEAVQEAFVRAVAAPAKVLAADSPDKWLRAVAFNIARTRHRRRQRLDVLLRRKPPEPVVLPGTSPDRVALLRAIRQLPRNQAEAITLHYLADLDVAEVGEIMSAPVGTVKSWLSRGRTKLAELMGEDR
jgi:RNA polymerase sigma factor (sigma-70 family)